jgi:glycosyltransferase involved in cell wall biosynthesis
MKTLYFFSNIASHYRAPLWGKLLDSPDFQFHLFFGKNKQWEIKEIDFKEEPFKNNQQRLHKLTNYWAKGRFLIWQSDVIKRCLNDKIDIAIFLGEFQVISTWLAVLFCKMRGIKVVFWTHGLYGNESVLLKTLRVCFYKTADEILLYEERAKELLSREGIKEKRMKVIYNSLNYDKHLELRNSSKITKNLTQGYFKNSKIPYLIFIGRLTKLKKLSLLIEALFTINQIDDKLNLILVGNGEEKESLKILIQELNLQDHVYLYGACYDETILASLIYNAILCVSPGNVGLTAIHSLSFGTPVCTHHNYFNQMPEVGVIKEDRNGCFFNENDSKSLSITIQKWVETSLDREEIRKECYLQVDKYYNPNYQLEVINKLF